MLKSRIVVIVAVVLLLAGAVPSWGQTVAAKGEEGRLIATLKLADASLAAKMAACRQLSIIGTKEAIAPLVALLGDEKLSHMARYGLEPIPDPAVDEAFRAALGRLEGRQLVGVIGSIGVRRDVKAVQPLVALLRASDTNPLAKGAIARTLGSIGTAEAAEVLMMSLDNAPPEGMADVYEGLFRCAERFAAEGDRSEAIRIYDALRQRDAAHQVRAGALRGAILTRGADGLGLLREYLGSDDYIMFSAAVQTAQEMPGGAVTEALTGALDGSSADQKILVAQTLGLRGDAKALPALYATAKRGAASSRVAAIKAVAEIGDVSSVPELVDLMGTEDRAVADAAQEALGSLPGEPVDATVMKMFGNSDPDRRLAALGLMERRRMTAAVPVLLRASGDGDARVRQAAIKMVGELGGPEQLEAVLDVLMALKTSSDIEAARQALSDVCGKASPPESCSGALIGRLKGAGTAQKIVLLRVLSGIGGQDALEAVRGTVGDADADVHAAAIRALGTWKTVDAAPHLLALAKGTDRALCLRAYLGMAGRRDLPVDERLSMCRQAGDLIRSTDEKRRLLGVLGGINAPEAMGVIAPYLNDAAVRREAVMASLAVADRLLKGRASGTHAPKLIAPLEKVVEAEGSGDLSSRAKELLQTAKTKAGR
jgi:HEAT repeat protein